MHGRTHNGISDIFHPRYIDRTAKDNSGGVDEGFDFLRYFHNVLVFIALCWRNALRNILGDDALELFDIQFV